MVPVKLLFERNLKSTLSVDKLKHHSHSAYKPDNDAMLDHASGRVPLTLVFLRNLHTHTAR